MYTEHNTPSAETPIQYFVMAWADADIADAMVAWLRDSHLAEVVAQPGFKDAQVVRMDLRSIEGKVGILSIYSVESSQALQTYFASAEKKRFEREGGRFAGKAQVQRFWGSPVLTLSSS